MCGAISYWVIASQLEPGRTRTVQTEKAANLCSRPFLCTAEEGEASTLLQASTPYTDSSAWLKVALGRITAKVFSRSGR